MGFESFRVVSLLLATKSRSIKSPVAPVSTIASVEVSSMVSVVFIWTGSIMHLESISRERITSFRRIRFSHFWRRGLGDSAGFKIGLGVLCAASSVSGSKVSRTENRLLSSGEGARLTRRGVQNPPRYLPIPILALLVWRL